MAQVCVGEHRLFGNVMILCLVKHFLWLQGVNTRDLFSQRSTITYNTSVEKRSFLEKTTKMKSFLMGMMAFCLFLEVSCGDMMRKSIVFNKDTPDVFYCPQDKPAGFDKMLVRAKSLNKLCEFDGHGLPEDYKSDCYNDVDESEFACSEKKRILMRLNPPNDTNIIKK